MRYFDVFPFFNELDLLELRLKTLDAYVDQFVLVEAPWTFQGNPKPLIFGENWDRFGKWNHKIRQVVMVENIETDNAWKREYATRNRMLSGLYDAEPDDFIFQSDLDEIWDPEHRDDLPDERLVTYGMHHFYYTLNSVRVPNLMWAGTRRVRRKDWLTGQAIRTSQGELLEWAGWHFSFLGDAVQASEKLKAFSHTEYSGPVYTDVDRIARCIEKGVDLINPAAKYVPVPVDETFPKPLLEEPERWQKFLLSPASPQ